MSRLFDRLGRFVVRDRVVVPVLVVMILVLVLGLNGFLLLNDASRADSSSSSRGNIPVIGAECILLGEKVTLGTDDFFDRGEENTFGEK